MLGFTDYKVRDLSYANTLVAAFRGALPMVMLRVACWHFLVAFKGCADQYAVRREAKQRGEVNEFAYRRVAGHLHKKYLETGCREAGGEGQVIHRQPITP